MAFSILGQYYSDFFTKRNEMNTNRFLLAGLVGGIVYLLLGYLVWGILLADVMSDPDSAGFMRDTPIWWALIIGNLAMGLLVAYIFERWARISTAETGAVAGATLGAFMAMTYDFVMYGTSNAISLTGVLIDIVAMTIVLAIVGAVVGWMLGRGADAVTD